MNRFVIPLLLVFFFIFESVFVQLVPADLIDGNYVFVPRFLILAIFFLAIYGSMKHGIIYGFIFGLLFDMVYTEIIGIYLFIIPLAAYLFSAIMKILQTNIFIVSIVSLFCIALLEVGVYQMNLLIHITDMDFSSFLKIRLVPTLILNLGFIILAAYPFKRTFDKFADTLRND